MTEPVLVTDSAAQVTITLRDGFELSDTPELLDAARAAASAGRPVVVESGEVAFLPTGVIQILVALRRDCLARGLPFAVAGVQDSAAAYLKLGGLDAVLRS